ncbi:hypothetical protein UNDYM_6015 (plasmid) [Undibacterium sp. YM2]|nr:hypothetical protein UNDYM_6015 [Undibacterium sp. YM2]
MGAFQHQTLNGIGSFITAQTGSIDGSGGKSQGAGTLVLCIVAIFGDLPLCIDDKTEQFTAA